MTLQLCSNKVNLDREQAKSYLATGDWISEIKHDGLRALVIKNGPTVNIFSRSGQNISLHLPILCIYVSKFHENDFVMDGEIVPVNGDLASVQRAFSGGRDTDNPVHFLPFDILALHSTDLRHMSQANRSLALEDVCTNNNISAPVQKTSIDLYDIGELYGREGVVLKHLAAPYVAGVSGNWVKAKYVWTVSCVAVDSGAPGMLDCMVEGEFGRVKVASVQVTENQVRPLIGGAETIIEIKAYGKNADNRLRHPVFGRVRLDQTHEDCGIEQLDSLRIY